MDLTILSDEQLESAWQKSAFNIETTLKSYYAQDTNKEFSDELLQKAKNYQAEQQLIQTEITKRRK